MKRRAKRYDDRMQVENQVAKMPQGGNLDELSRLLVPGTIGFYNLFEVTEIVAFRNGAKTPINVFTIAVAEERTQEVIEGYRFLSDRIELRSLKDWKFGIVRYSRPIAELEPAISDITSRQVWRASGNDLTISSMTPLPSKLVPSDGMSVVPLNRVLKNNFWDGSHVLEWADPKKEMVRPLFDDPPRLQELSDRVNEVVPIRIGALSDRLGNIILQLPVTVITSKFDAARPGNGLKLKLGWHPKASPRDLVVTCERNSDGFVSSFNSVRVTGPETDIDLASSEGHYRATIAEVETGTLLAATGEFDYMSAVPMNIHLLSNRTRTFVLKDDSGQETEKKVGIITHQAMMVGTPYVDPNGGFTQGRVYDEEISRLLEERRFVQYAKDPSAAQADRVRALQDIRKLINDHGEAGAWLWDPFLNARDILETLFFCHRYGVDLRALTSGKEPPEEESRASAEDFVARQRQIFRDARSNLEGLRLEFRRRYASHGTAFHDRFLIFPRTQRRKTLVWSLGTSVNGVGKEHHILQQVDNGQAIMDAFLELWNQLTEREHLIWRHP
jgi:hypothetical protein